MGGLVDDAIDFVVFIVFLGLCVSVAFGIVTPQVNEQIDKTEKVLIDKTTPTLQGYENESSFDGTMSKLEVTLMTQVQDFDIPVPKRYKVNTVDAKIEPTYRSSYSLNKYGNDVYTELNHSDTQNTSKYTIEYNYGDTSSIDDDFYFITKP